MKLCAALCSSVLLCAALCSSVQLKYVYTSLCSSVQLCAIPRSSNYEKLNRHGSVALDLPHHCKEVFSKFVTNTRPTFCVLKLSLVGARTEAAPLHMQRKILLRQTSTYMCYRSPSSVCCLFMIGFIELPSWATTSENARFPL